MRQEEDAHGQRGHPARTPRHRRVLVTGFNDWNDLGPRRNIWKCDQNPSCRLLVGGPTTTRPTSYTGPLVRQLQGSLGINWEFRTLPTTWGIARRINYQQYDAVINTGFGVYDTSSAIQLEENAYNQRSGSDALGHRPGRRAGQSATEPVPIDSSNRSTTLSPASGAGMHQRMAHLAGQHVTSGYLVRLAQARANNTYICNETHYHALSELNRSLRRHPPGRLRLVYFIHLPQPPNAAGYSSLAAGTAQVIRGLLA